MSDDNPRYRLVNRNYNPLLATLPIEFSEFRAGQVEAIAEAMDAYRRGVKCVIIDAPTGSGKTLIGETIRRLVGAGMDEPRTSYVCSSKSLQVQFARDFPYSRLLMGRANYPTERHPERFRPGERFGNVSCEDCTWSADHHRCDLCWGKHVCPYEIAKKAAIDADLAVLNGSYLLTEANGPGRFSGRHFLICDEADTLETQLMGHVEVDVSARRMELFGWDAPKVTVEADWERWCAEKCEDVAERVASAEFRVGSGDEKAVKEVKYLQRLEQNLTRIVKDMEGGRSFWVYCGDKERAAFKPSRVNNYGQEMLWKHAEKHLLMSATIISADELMFSLGWESGAYHTISLPSTFPIANRLTVIRPVADMSRANDGADMGKLFTAIREICGRHSTDRILIHSVSYALTTKIQRALQVTVPGRPVISYTNSASRESALAKYRRTPGAILVAPSLDRGVDLPGDDCRVQIIAKCPFPNLGDKVIGARFRSGAEGKTWYTVQTIRSIVQMTGRAVRSESDWARTYILDSQFSDRVWSNARLFPKWWKDAVVWER